MESKIPLNESTYKQLYRKYHKNLVSFGEDLFDADWDDWQKELAIEFVKEDKDIFFIRKSAHSTGKSFFSAIATLFVLLLHNDPGIVLTSNTSAQLINKLGRELRIQAEKSLVSEFFECTTTKIYRKRFNGKPDPTAFAELCVNNENNVAAFSGLHATNVLFVADECASLDPGIHQAILSSTSKPVKGARRRLLYFLNPLFSTGVAFDIFNNPEIGKYWDKGTLNAFDCKHSDKEYASMLVEAYGADSDIVRVRVLGEFPRVSSSQLISSMAIDDSVNRPLDKHDYAFDPIIMSVDPSRFGDDRSVIMFRQGPYIHKPVILPDSTITDLAGLVIDEFNKVYPRPSAIVVDAVGLGAGLYDILRDRLGSLVVEFVGSRKSLYPEQYNNMRTETYINLKKAIEGEGVRLPSFPDLLTELREIEYGYSPSLTMMIEAKHLIKKRTGKSPDLADACSMLYFNIDRENARRIIREPPKLKQAMYAW